MIGVGNFLVAADQHKVVIFNSKSGEYIRTLMLPQRYADRNLRGHKDFAFSEDGITVMHSQRNFPIVADIIRFW